MSIASIWKILFPLTSNTWRFGNFNSMLLIF